MLLRERFAEYPKEYLSNLAKLYGITKISKLRKAELIDRIVEWFCTEKAFRERMACLTNEELNLFRRACKSPQEIGSNEMINSVQLSRDFLGDFDEHTDRFYIYKEVAVAFTGIDDEDFRKDQQKKGWMMKCLRFFVKYYGIAPIETIYTLYRMKMKDSMDEMEDMLVEMPIDMTESDIFLAEILDIEDIAKDVNLDSPYGLLLHLPLMEDGELMDLINEQRDKPFYIPTVQQIEELTAIGYEASSLAYKRLEKFFRKKLGMTWEQAQAWSLEAWNNTYEGGYESDLISQMLELGVPIDNDDQLNELVELLNDTHNNTRMRENRGHKPDELSIIRRNAAGMPTIAPTIVPGSSLAADILMEAAPYMEEMGISVDINGNSDRISTAIKVYPNDPCPCGSGKKYKKCCGRKA